MKIIRKSVLLSLCLMFNEGYAVQTTVPTKTDMNDYELQQVVIVSRHGLRSPLTEGSKEVKSAVPLEWPTWNTKPGQLTTKGGALEVYMGGYFIDWLNKEGLVKKDICPSDKDLFVYTNVMPRTIATAQHFVNGAFPGCQITINHLNNLNDKDPLFYQSIKDNNETFINSAEAEINKFINSQDFSDSYKKLQQIINYAKSSDCLEQKACDLSKINNEIHLDYGKEPYIVGPLKKSFSIIDAFMLQDYEGFPKAQVAWGKIKTNHDWQTLAKLRNSYIEAAYNQPIVVKNIIKPMLTYLDQKLPQTLSDNDSKVTLIVGHDTTVGPIINALGFDEYKLPGQYEKTPIGGKLVFERWINKSSKEQFVKVEYIYQSTKQIRDLESLTLNNPPQRVTLKLKDCKNTSQGLCAWDDFRNIIKNAIN